MTLVGVVLSGTQQAEGSVHCPRAPTLEPSSKQRAPTQEPAPSARKSKVVSCRPRASHSSSQGRDVGLALSGLRFLALPVGRSGWPVLVPCPLSLLVVSLVVPCFFGCVSSLCLKRTGRRPRNRAFLSGTLRNPLQWWLLGRRCTLLLWFLHRGYGSV